MKIAKCFLFICRTLPIIIQCSLVAFDIYSPEEIQKFILENAGKKDCIEFRNDRKEFLECQLVPLLSYSFGDQSFQPEEIAFIGIFSEGTTLKGQYLTFDGKLYVADIKDSYFILEGEPWHPSAIKRIVFQPKNQQNSSEPFTHHHLRFRDGNLLPVAFLRSFVVTDGLSERVIDPCQILDISFDGGVFGQLLEERNRLNGEYIKEAELSYIDLQTMQPANVSISGISHIQKDEGAYLIDWNLVFNHLQKGEESNEIHLFPFDLYHLFKVMGWNGCSLSQEKANDLKYPIVKDNHTVQ